MAGIDPQDYINIATEDLIAELEGLENEFVRLKFDHATRGIDNPLRLRIRRRDLARLRTELRKRELSEMSETDLKKRSKLVARRARKN